MRENKQMAYRLVIKETSNPAQSKNPKIASMFLTQGSLPFELLWDKFSMYVIYIFLIFFSCLFNLCFINKFYKMLIRGDGELFFASGNSVE